MREVVWKGGMDGWIRIHGARARAREREIDGAETGFCAL